MKICIGLLAVATAAVALAATGGPGETRLVFTKSFPGSSPAFEEIAIAKSGAGTYREDATDEDPVKFQMSASDVAQMFGLADKLDHFSRPLESTLKVANMGKKTFRYEGEAKPSEVTFNYSEDLDAKSLADLFERIGETERGYLELERAVKFDKLGAQQAILRVEILKDQKRLVAADQFLPLLDRVVKNESFLHMARDRAAALAEWIRALPK